MDKASFKSLFTSRNQTWLKEHPLASMIFPAIIKPLFFHSISHRFSLFHGFPWFLGAFPATLHGIPATHFLGAPHRRAPLRGGQIRRLAVGRGTAVPQEKRRLMMN
jgi:hypothetical protein